MRRVVEFDLVTKSEANRRGNSTIAQVIHAKEVKAQREAVRNVLRAHLGTPPPLHVVQLGDGTFTRPGPSAIGYTVPNKLTINLTRIAPGTLDDDNIGASLKHVRDEIAAWCGTPNDRDPLYKWSVPPAQEKAAPGVYRVRIEILDKLTGEERVVKLAETRSAAVEAERRVKKAISAQVKARGIYHAEDAAKGASSSARAKAERAFAKVTGKAREAARRIEDPLELGDHHADARRPTPPRPDRDPGEERSARDVTDCTTCGAPRCRPCYPKAGVRMVFGVHVARARAAGLHVPDDDRGAVKPARAPKGRRKLAPVAQPQLPLRRAFVALPWEQPDPERCAKCGWMRHEHVGSGMCPGGGYLSLRFFEPTSSKRRVLAPAPRYDGLDEPPTTITAGVPSEHVARYGTTITLTREPFTSPQTGRCWLYTTTKETT